MTEHLLDQVLTGVSLTLHFVDFVAAEVITMKLDLVSRAHSGDRPCAPKVWRSSNTEGDECPNGLGHQRLRLIGASKGPA
jgi:hypothetical protein